MQNHTKIYLEEFGFDQSDFIPCEICNNRAVDIHHITPRGMGGDPLKKRDVIENLMALCRICHDQYGDKKQHKEMLLDVHAYNIHRNKIKRNAQRSERTYS